MAELSEKDKNKENGNGERKEKFNKAPGNGRDRGRDAENRGSSKEGGAKRRRKRSRKSGERAARPQLKPGFRDSAADKNEKESAEKPPVSVNRDRDVRARKRAKNRRKKIEVDELSSETVLAAETIEDIKKDSDRIEKEIWLEIADIHTVGLD